MEQKKIGVFLARFQPLHNAHLYVIEKALKECDKVVIMLGSSNKNNMIRNPFDFNLRYNLLKDSLKNVKDMERINIFELPDWSQESKEEDNLTWGSYLYYNVVSRINQKSFTIYYSDKPEYLLSWFTDEIKEKISCRFLERFSRSSARNGLTEFPRTG